MARIQLRYATIYLLDGLAGAAAVNQSMTAPMAGDTTLTVDTVVLNTDITTQIPIGSRFTIAGETDTTAIHTVQTRMNTMSVTTQVTFSPPLGPGTYVDNGVLTFLPHKLSIKVGDGDVKYTENTDYKYDLDRGLLDTVRLGDDTPMDVDFNFVYEHITTGTNEVIAPMDALKRKNSASEWVSSATDKCEPYAVDVVIDHVPPCGTSQIERTTFPDFRADKREVSFKDSNIAITGKCNVLEPIVERPDTDLF